MFAAIAANKSSLNAHRGCRRRRPQVLDFHLPSHRRQAAYSNGLTHRLVEKGGDDSSMQESWWAFKDIGNRGHRDNRLILGDKEVEMKADGVGRTASEASILRGVSQRCEVFLRHRFRIPVCRQIELIQVSSYGQHKF